MTKLHCFLIPSFVLFLFMGLTACSSDDTTSEKSYEQKSREIGRQAAEEIQGHLDQAKGIQQFSHDRLENIEKTGKE